MKVTIKTTATACDTGMSSTVKERFELPDDNWPIVLEFCRALASDNGQRIADFAEKLAKHADTYLPY